MLQQKLCDFGGWRVQLDKDPEVETEGIAETVRTGRKNSIIQLYTEMMMNLSQVIAYQIILLVQMTVLIWASFKYLEN